MTERPPPNPRPNPSIDWASLPYGGDLFGEMHLAEQIAPGAEAPQPSLFPGLAACAVAAAASAWLSEHYGFPIILLGLLVGLSLNFIAGNPSTHRGLDFASRTCLRVGIVVLGFQVTLAQIGALGLLPCSARSSRANRPTPGYWRAARPRSAAQARRSRSTALSVRNG